MERTLALLLSAAALASPAGCVAVGGGWADNWSVPAPMAEPDRYTGVDFSLSAPFVTLGHYRYRSDEEKLTANYVAHDLGFWQLARLGVIDPGRARWWPVLKPVLGKYRWSQSPDGSGLLTGMKVGAGVVLDDRRSIWLLTFEYGWLRLHDAVADNDARLQTARFALVWVPNVGPMVSPDTGRRGPDRGCRIAGVPGVGARPW